MNYPENLYEKAFNLVFPNLGSNYQIKKEEFSNTYLVKSGNKYYRISENLDLESDCKGMLNSPTANEIPINIWIELAGEIHNDLDYQNSVFSLVADNKNAWDILSEAFDQNHQSSKKFWKSLRNLEEIDIYPSAINIAYHFYLDHEITVKRLTEQLIKKKYFNEMQNGIFEVVKLKEFEKVFYIYSVGSVNW
jgi:hypothetical protein